MTRLFSRLLPGVLLFALFSALSAGAQTKEAGDLWEVTNEMSMPGMPAGMQMPQRPPQRICRARNSDAPPVADNDGRCKDPLLMPGEWNNNSGYALYMTQCPCLSGCVSGFSGGGMDDRFDFWLTSYSMQDGEGLDWTGNTIAGYAAYGNDGQHFNDDINGGGFNNAVGLAVANALHDASDHLPVVMVIQIPARVSVPSLLSFGSVITGAVSKAALPVANAAVAPADELTYAYTPPAGFTAPAGSRSANAGAPANADSIGMDTATPGFKSGTLAMATDDPDSLKNRRLPRIPSRLQHRQLLSLSHESDPIYQSPNLPICPCRVYLPHPLFTTGSTQMLRPIAGAMMRSSAITRLAVGSPASAAANESQARFASASFFMS